mmetsp:Transcript_66627/g.59775  ORF Transcript_66627/g.59775 Transcript_66627/m.59775 type:complete len:115 (+) Transcript_66627:101-445(+)
MPELNGDASKKYGIITYHTNDNLGDKDLYEQFGNPIFMLISIILILFSSFMLVTIILLSCSCLRPHCSKCQKFTKRRCRCMKCKGCNCCGKKRLASMSTHNSSNRSNWSSGTAI